MCSALLWREKGDYSVIRGRCQPKVCWLRARGHRTEAQPQAHAHSHLAVGATRLPWKYSAWEKPAQLTPLSEIIKAAKVSDRH